MSVLLCFAQMLRTISALCLVSTMLLVATQAAYSLFPDTDATVCPAIEGSPYHDPSGAGFSAPVLMTLCEALGCTSFNPAGYLTLFAHNTSRQSYISMTSCGNGNAPSFSNGTACSPPGTVYLQCAGVGDAIFNAYASYQLPPFLVEQACDKDASCAGYMVTSDGTQGWLLEYGGYSNIVSNIRL